MQEQDTSAGKSPALKIATQVKKTRDKLQQKQGEAKSRRKHLQQGDTD